MSAAQPKLKPQVDASTRGRRTNSFVYRNVLIDSDGAENITDFWPSVQKQPVYHETPNPKSLFTPTPKHQKSQIQTPQDLMLTPNDLSQQNNQNYTLIEEEEEVDIPFEESKIENNLTFTNFSPITNSPNEAQSSYLKKDYNMLSVKTPERATFKKTLNRQSRVENVSQISDEMTPTIKHARENINNIQIPSVSPYVPSNSTKSSPARISAPSSPKLVNVETTPINQKNISSPFQDLKKSSQKKDNLINISTNVSPKPQNLNSNNNAIQSEINPISQIESNFANIFYNRFNHNQQYSQRNRNFPTSRLNTNLLKDDIPAINQVTLGLYDDSKKIEKLDYFNQFGAHSSYSSNNQKKIPYRFSNRHKKQNELSSSSSDDDYHNYINKNEMLDLNVQQNSSRPKKDFLNFDNENDPSKDFERLIKRRQNQISKENAALNAKFRKRSNPIINDNNVLLNNVKPIPIQITNNQEGKNSHREKSVRSNGTNYSFRRRQNSSTSSSSDDGDDDGNNNVMNNDINNYHKRIQKISSNIKKDDFMQSHPITRISIDAEQKQVDNGNALTRQKITKRLSRDNDIIQNNLKYANSSSVTNDNESSKSSENIHELNNANANKTNSFFPSKNKSDNNSKLNLGEFKFTPPLDKNYHYNQTTQESAFSEQNNQLNQQQQIHLQPQEIQTGLQFQAGAQFQVGQQFQSSHQFQQLQQPYQHHVQQHLPDQQANQQIPNEQQYHPSIHQQTQFQFQLHNKQESDQGQFQYQPEFPQSPDQYSHLHSEQQQYQPPPEYQPQTEQQFLSQPEQQLFKQQPEQQLFKQQPEQQLFQPQPEQQLFKQQQFQQPEQQLFKQQPEQQLFKQQPEQQLFKQQPEQQLFQPQPEQQLFKQQSEQQQPFQQQLEQQLFQPQPEQQQFQQQPEQQLFQPQPEQQLFKQQSEQQQPFQQQLFQPQPEQQQFQQQPEQQLFHQQSEQQQPFQQQLEQQLFQPQPEQQQYQQQPEQQLFKQQPDQQQTQDLGTQENLQLENLLEQSLQSGASAASNSDSEASQAQEESKKELNFQLTYESHVDEPPIFQPSRQMPAYSPDSAHSPGKPAQKQNAKAAPPSPARVSRKPESIASGIFNFDIDKSYTSIDDKNGKSDTLTESDSESESENKTQRIGAELLELIKTPKSILKKRSEENGEAYKTPTRKIRIERPENNTYFPHLPISPAPDVNRMMTPARPSAAAGSGKEDEEESSDGLLFNEIFLNEAEHGKESFAYPLFDDDDDEGDEKNEESSNPFSTPVRKSMTLAEMEQNSIRKIRRRHHHRSQASKEEADREEERQREELEEAERKRQAREEEEKRKREEEEEERRRQAREEEEKRRREEEEEERRRKAREEEEKRRREEEEEEERRKKQVQDEEKAQEAEAASGEKKRRRRKTKHSSSEQEQQNEASLQEQHPPQPQGQREEAPPQQPSSFEEMHNSSFPDYSLPKPPISDSSSAASSQPVPSSSVVDVSTFQPLPSASPSPSMSPQPLSVLDNTLPSLPSSPLPSDDDVEEVKKTKTENGAKKTKKQKTVENTPSVVKYNPEFDDLPIALRRAKRPTTKPLRYWMNEKIIYRPAPNGCLTQYAVQTDLQNSDEIDPLSPSNAETIDTIIQESQKLKNEKEKKKKTSSAKNDSEVIPKRIIPGIENPETSIISFKGIEKRTLKSNEIEILPQKSLDLDASKNKIMVVFSGGVPAQIEYRNGNKWKVRPGGQAYICKGDFATVRNLNKEGSVYLFAIYN